MVIPVKADGRTIGVADVLVPDQRGLCGRTPYIRDSARESDIVTRLWRHILRFGCDFIAGLYCPCTINFLFRRFHR